MKLNLNLKKKFQRFCLGLICLLVLIFQSNIPNGNCVGSGREYGHTGHLHHTTIADNSTTITMRKYDATAVSNAYLHGSITYTTD